MKLVIDTDPGVDDALAILMAHAAPDCEVLALTIAAGNVGLDHTTRNALKLLELIDAKTPVYPGAATVSATSAIRRPRASPKRNTRRRRSCGSRARIRAS